MPFPIFDNVISSVLCDITISYQCIGIIAQAYIKDLTRKLGLVEAA